MVKATKWLTLVAMLSIVSLLLSACGGDNTPTTGAGAAPTNTTAAAPPAAATNTTAPAAPAATDTTAAPAMTATEAMPAMTPTEAMAATPGGTGGTGFKFDPSAYKKNQVEDGATLRVSSWGDPSEQQVNKDSLARFQQVYPNVKINYEPQPDNYQTKLLAQVSGKTEPDVFYVDPGLGYQFIPAGVLLDLTPALTEVGRSKDDYFPSLISVFEDKDGKVYGLPKDFGSLAFFYNTDMLAKSGAPTPKDGWTQDDFHTFVMKSVQGSGQTQIFGTSTDQNVERWGAFALANGAKIIDNNKCALNSDAGVSTLEWWYGMYKDKIATLPSDVGAGWTGEAFAKMRTASDVEGGWLLPFMADPKNGFQNVKFDVVPLPVGKTGNKADLLFFNAWGVSSRTKYPKAAAALALFLASRENEDAILQTGFANPTLKGMENDPFFQGTGVVNKASKILYDTANYGLASYYGGVNDPKIKDALNKATQQVFAGQMAPKDALDQACQTVDGLLAGGQ